MKTLSQIEPRTPISSLPVTITNSGSFYLTTNLTGIVGTNGITVLAGVVTIDLNGFSLTGTFGSGGSNQHGIFAGSGVNSIAIYNGIVGKWSNDGIRVAASSCQITKVRSWLNYGRGINGSVGTLTDCISEFNANDGIFMSSASVISGCVARQNLERGIVSLNTSVIRDCTAWFNESYGFDLNGSQTVSGCMAFGNYDDGFLVGPGSTIKDCVANENKDTGFKVGNGSTILNCTAILNGTGSNGEGIYTGAEVTVTGCTTVSNKSDGILVDSNCLVTGNNSSGHTTLNRAGIAVGGQGARIDSNHCRSNYYGIFVSSTNHVVIRNTARGSIGAAYSIAAGNAAGPIATTTGTITNLNPWTNFAY